MKIFRLPQLVDASCDGTFRVGAEGSTVYMLYGRIRQGESGRKAGSAGADEIICVIKGAVKVRAGKTSFIAGPGEAFCARGEVSIENACSDDAIYLAAGSTAQAAPERKAPSEAERTEPKKEAPPVEEEREFIITRDNGPEEA